MKKFRIDYIDGHDLKYKTFDTEAENPDDAVSNLWKSYSNGDFDHTIIGILEVR